MLDVALLGTSGMMPLPNRFLTAMFLRLNGRFLLLDCGEGTQVSLKMLGWGFKNIDVILFTHFHADHIAGLPGLLLTIGNAGRTEPLTIIGPKHLAMVIKCLMVIAPELPYEIMIEEMAGPCDFHISEFRIRSLPVDHRVDCYCYTVEVKRAGKFNPEKARASGAPMACWSRLQKGETVVLDGNTYTPEMVLGEARKGIKVAYCTDTRPIHTIPSFILGADLFICEGIYGENEKLEKAKGYKHMLFREAAELAQKGNVAELWLTHFSPSLTEPEAYLPVAREIFPNSFCGRDRKWKTLRFEEE